MGKLLAIILWGTLLAQTAWAEEVLIESDPEGAEVYVGDASKSQGKTPLTIELSPGDHILILKKSGYQESFEQIQVEEKSGTQKFKFTLIELPKISVVLKAGDGADGAEVFVNDEKLGEVPGTLRVPAGNYTFEFRKAGFKTLQRQLDIDFDRDNQYEIALEKAAVSNVGPGGNALGTPQRSLSRAYIVAGAQIRNQEFLETAMPAEFKAPGVAGYGFQAELYPIPGDFKGIGLHASLLRTVSLETVQEGGGGSITSTLTVFDLGLQYRHSIPDVVDLVGGIGFRLMRHNFDDGAALYETMPDVGYGALRMRLQAERMTEWVGGYLGADFLLNQSFGVLEERYENVSGSGYGIRAGLMGRYQWMSVLVGFDWYRQDTSFEAGTATLASTGSNDTWMSIVGGIGATF